MDKKRDMIIVEIIFLCDNIFKTFFFFFFFFLILKIFNNKKKII